MSLKFSHALGFISTLENDIMIGAISRRIYVSRLSHATVSLVFGLERCKRRMKGKTYTQANILHNYCVKCRRF